jgi:hypothetical protein
LGDNHLRREVSDGQSVETPHLVGDRGTGHPIFPPELIATLFERAGLERVERLEVPDLPLGQFLRIPHDRFCLQVFRRGSDAS